MKKALLAMVLGFCLATPLTASAKVCYGTSHNKSKKEARKKAKNKAARKCSKSPYKLVKSPKSTGCSWQGKWWSCSAKARGKK